MQSCCFGFEQHRGRWAVFSATFHHAVAHNQKLYTSLVSIQGFSPPVSCAQGRLVNELHTHKVLAYEVHAHKVSAHEVHIYEVSTYEVHVHEVPVYEVSVERNCSTLRGT
jgi:hypothetical protein